MQSMTLVRCDPEPPDAPTRWQVGFDVVLDDGSERHYPVTVFASRVASPDQETVIEAARQMVLPGVAAEDAAVAAPPPEDGEG